MRALFLGLQHTGISDGKLAEAAVGGIHGSRRHERLPLFLEQRQFGTPAGKVGNPHAKQAHGLAEVEGVEDGEGVPVDGIAPVGRRGTGLLPAHGCEVSMAHSQVDGFTGHSVASRPAPNHFGKLQQVLAQPLPAGDVLRQRHAMANAFDLWFLFGRDDRGIVEPSSHLAEPLADHAEAPLQYVDRVATELAAGKDPERGQLFLDAPADPAQFLDRHPFQERDDFLRGDDGQAIGLLHLAGELGQQLVRGDADRTGQPEGLTDASLEKKGDPPAHGATLEVAFLLEGVEVLADGKRATDPEVGGDFALGGG